MGITKKHVIILFFSITIFCCTKHNNVVINENINLFSNFPQKDTVKFKKILEFKNGVAGKLYLKDSTLIIFNLTGKKNFFFYNYFIRNDSLSEGYLSSGRGPGEAIGAMSSGISNNILWTHDLTLNKILTTKIESKSLRTNKLVFNEHPLKDRFYMMEYIDSLNLFGVGYINSLFKIQQVDLFTGKIKKQFGEFKYIPNDKPSDSYKAAYDCFILAKPSGEKLVLTYRFSDIIEIFDLNNNTSVASHGPEIFHVDFNPLPEKSFNVMGRTSKTRFAFINAAVTDNYIYALYSGKLCNTRNSYFSSYIFVYDWDGNPIKKILLDREALSLTVSEDDRDIYIYDPNNGYIMKNQ